MISQCQELGIPDYLTSSNLTPDPNFYDEIIYRRYNISGKVEDWRKERKFSAAIFPVRNDSCNRGKYSKEPKDVLYNTRPEDKGNHYFYMGIISFKSDFINDHYIPSSKINGELKSFQLKLEHTPLHCMYPHCEIKVLENGILLSGSPPRNIRALVRDYLLDGISIEKDPD